MQHGLLGLALALIVAIVAALAAPLFVDWNAWRPEFERRASELVGTPVAIQGPIEASILPTPAFVLRDVTVGDAEAGTGLTTGQIRGILSLGALFRGAVEAEEIVLARPKMRLTLGPDGRVAVKQAGGAVTSLSISRFSVEGGTLVLDDRANGKQYRFNDVAAAGELQSRDGPVKVDASFTEDGKPRNNAWKLRAATGQFADGRGKLRLSLTRSDAAQFDGDGTLALTARAPSFEGRINFSRPGHLPLRLAANATASIASLALDELEISLGGEAPAEFAGQAQMKSWKRGLFEAELAAKFVDLDRAEGAQKQGIAAALAPIRDMLAGFQGEPFSGKAKLSIAQLVAGGGNVRDLAASFSVHEGVIAPERFDAKLPGRASISVKSVPVGGGDFKGQWTVSAEDPAALAEWTGLLPPDLMGNGPFKLDGGLALSGDRLTLDPFLLSLGPTKLGGELAYEPATPARVQMKLNGSEVDMALLAPLARKLLAKESAVDVDLSLDVLAPRILNQSARRLSVALSRKADGVALDSFRIDDLGGLNLSASGRAASYPERPKGRIEFTADAGDPAGLNELASAFASPEIAAYVRRIAAAAMPLQLKGAIAGDGNGPVVAMDASGKAGETQLSLRSRGSLQPLSMESGELVLEAADASHLVGQIGLPTPEPQAGQGRFELALGKPDRETAPLKAHLVFPGIDLSGEGALRWAESGVEPRINLKLEATDFRALSIAAARISDTIVPASGTARLIRADGGIALEDFALNFGDTRMRGRLAMKGIEAPALSGELSVNKSDLATLLALGLGRAGEGAPWSDRPLGPLPLSGASGDFSLESASLGLAGNLAASGVRMKLHFDRDRMTIEDLTGDLAGGKLAAHARISRPDLISVDGGFSLASADIARLLSPADWKAGLRGKGSIRFDLAGQGASPAQLMGNIAGKGSYTLEPFEIDELAPGALEKVLAATAKNPPDEAGVRALLGKAVSEAPLKLAKLEGPLVAANGVVRAGKVAFKAGSADAAAEAAIDLARLDLDASVGFEMPAPKGVNVRPAFSVVWRGPLAQPARGFELSPLLAAISMRAMDSEMQKIRDRATVLGVPLPLPSLATETPPSAPKPKAPPRPKPQPQPAQDSRAGQLDPIH